MTDIEGPILIESEEMGVTMSDPRLFTHWAISIWLASL